MKKRLLFLIPALSMLFGACGGTPTNENSIFEGIEFNDSSVVYDGNVHKLEITGTPPEGTNITYFSEDTPSHINEATEAGTYRIHVELTKDNYDVWTEDAILTISEKAFSGITFSNSTIEYDGNSHTIVVQGVPEFASVLYEDNGPFANAGTYPMSVTVSADNYEDLTLNATLTINAKSFSGISFANSSVDYDGNPHKLEIVGTLPEGANVNYSSSETPLHDNEATDAGVYHIAAELTKENYQTLTLNATLTIGKIPFGNVTFENRSFEYDGNAHSITITGNVPAGATVTYSSEDTPNKDNYATDVGEYSIRAAIKEKNHNDLVLDAVLNITASDAERFMIPNGNNLFFQNAIDDDKLYVADLSSNELTKISNDRARDMIPFGEGMMFVSQSLASSIKSVVPASEAFERELIHTKNARYIQKDEGNIIYYAHNGLTNESSGIYKFDYTDSDNPIETLLSVGKAKYLKLVDSKLYFADGTNEWKLSSINTSGIEQTRTLVVDEKINCLISEGDVLFYTVNNLLGDYLERYNISAGLRKKLTSDAGASLTIVGNYIYYINVDLLSSAIIGDGIYRVNKAPVAENSNPGTKVIAAGEQGFCSLISDGGTKLYYYDVDGYKLISYNIDTEESANLLEGFVKPEDPAPMSISDGLSIQSYAGVIYYLDLWDERTLHQYNPVTKANIRITSNKVASFSIIGDEMYFNLVTRLVNNDTYKMNLKVGSEPELINVNSGFDFVQLGDYIYYSMDNAAGAATAIHRFNIETYTDEEMHAKGVSNLRVAGGKLLFIDGYQIFNLDPSTKVVTEIKAGTKSVHTTAFDTDGTFIYTAICLALDIQQSSYRE